MSTTTYYTFFDQAVMDPVWMSSWTTFFSKFPGGRKRIAELIEFSLNPEPSEKELAAVFANKTLAWTIRHSTPQFFVMSEIMSMTPKLNRHAVEVTTWYSEDFFTLVAAAVDDLLTRKSKPSQLQAVLKLHNVERPSVWLKLPRRVAKQVNDTVPMATIGRPIYRWQGREACQYSDFGLWNYDVENCLNPRETGRFLDFFEGAWEQNLPVKYLPAHLRTDMSANQADRIPSFRQFELCRKLKLSIQKLRKMIRPCVFRFST